MALLTSHSNSAPATRQNDAKPQWSKMAEIISKKPTRLSHLLPIQSPTTLCFLETAKPRKRRQSASTACSELQHESRSLKDLIIKFYEAAHATRNNNLDPGRRRREHNSEQMENLFVPDHLKPAQPEHCLRWADKAAKTTFPIKSVNVKQVQSPKGARDGIRNIPPEKKNNRRCLHADDTNQCETTEIAVFRSRN